MRIGVTLALFIAMTSAAFAGGGFDIVIPGRPGVPIIINGVDASYERFVREKLDALAGLRPRLVKDVQNLPGARVLEDRFTAVQQAVGTPKTRLASAAFLAAFIEEAKTSGLVARLIERHGVQGVSVAPAASE